MLLSLETTGRKVEQASWIMCQLFGCQCGHQFCSDELVSVKEKCKGFHLSYVLDIAGLLIWYRLPKGGFCHCDCLHVIKGNEGYLVHIYLASYRESKGKNGGV